MRFVFYPWPSAHFSTKRNKINNIWFRRGLRNRPMLLYIRLLISVPLLKVYKMDYVNYILINSLIPSLVAYLTPSYNT